MEALPSSSAAVPRRSSSMPPPKAVRPRKRKQSLASSRAASVTGPATEIIIEKTAAVAGTAGGGTAAPAEPSAAVAAAAAALATLAAVAPKSSSSLSSSSSSARSSSSSSASSSYSSRSPRLAGEAVVASSALPAYAMARSSMGPPPVPSYASSATGPASTGRACVATCVCGRLHETISTMSISRFRTLMRKHAPCHRGNSVSFLAQTQAWCRYDGSPWRAMAYLPQSRPSPPSQEALAEQCMLFMNADDSAGVRRLLDQGLDPNYTNRFGYTLLHRACKANSLGAFQELHSRGANALVVDDCGRTVLHEVCWSRRPFDLSMLEATLEISPDLLTAEDRLGATPLNYMQDPKYGNVVIQVIVANADRFWWSRSRGEPVTMPRQGPASSASTSSSSSSSSSSSRSARSKDSSSSSSSSADSTKRARVIN